ncbi:MULTISPECIES: sulfite exporter TauE/SafE family protein [unclassified Acinetobacter]|uniref:sulfite exporter TauE/SafE family protein n=1 Tax=unclassified Acinetobacter TaxID=196816 RepID=UPI00157BAC27|nr:MULTISPECIES: sulfite exporter TauE/SafE family protein [unclassified Acinetobacter]MDM1757345.1 sulfite exporter TauE/SafE family protein [Acinetobacter sp. 256-1]MDM1760337.1 sulfite exporter TauE/SafE family protein [Acinetobacter sp. 251-1]
MIWVIFCIGAMLAGFVQGLTGFAFALIAMSCWIWVLPAQVAAPLLVFASLWSHCISLGKEQKHTLPFSLVKPYIFAGLIGVPLGTALLHYIHQDIFKIVLGVFLIFWCPIIYFAPALPRLKKMGKTADRIVGFLGGILGGLGGFCGALPSAWVMLKQLSKEQQRYILRHFNFAIQLFTLLVYLWHGTLNSSHLSYIIVLMITVSIPAILGAQLFYKISEQQFKRIVLSLLFMSGLFLSTSTLL